MLAALACVSSQGIWILADSAATEIIATTTWNDSESSDVAAEIGPRLEHLLRISSPNSSAPPDFSRLSGLYAVSGPGAFTGLRVTASFVAGLARALGLSARPIPTFDLLGHAFQIPLQHQRQKLLPLAQIAAQGEEILLIQGTHEASIRIASAELAGKGFAEEPLWPRDADLLKALRKNLASQAPLDIFYGLNPKISGQRLP